MKTTLKHVIFLSALATAYPLFAAESDDKDNRNPSGCRDVGYEFDLNALRILPQDGGEKQAMFFIFNKRKEPVHLFQMRNQESSRSMYFNHSINANQWAVLSTIEKQMKYLCTVSQSGTRYGKIVSCADSIRVCQFTNVKYGLNNRGNYWLVNSNTRGGALRDVVHYGIIPAI